MNRLIASCLAAIVAVSAAAASAIVANEDFFIVSSVDERQSTMVLKRPTEVTLTMRVTPKTQFRDEQSKAIPLSRFRAGDTVFIASDRDASGQLVASSIRQGVMTLEELRRRYLRSR